MKSLPERESVNPEIGPFPRILSLLGRAVPDLPQLLPSPDAQTGLGVGDLAGDIIHQPFQAVGSGGAEVSAAVAVGVDVGNRMGLQLGAVLLHKFC